MQTESCGPTHQSLADTLERALVGHGDPGPTILELTEAVGDKGFGLLLMVLSLPSALPVPAPGYSIPFGIAMAIIACQIFVGRRTIWLPKKLQAVRIPSSLAGKMAGAGTGFLRQVERLIKPRLEWLHTRSGHAALAVVIFAMATFMMIPIPGTNTLPAMAIFIIGVSMAERDGLIAIGAMLCAVLAAFLSGTILYLAITRGPGAVEDFKVWVKALLGFGGEEG